MGPEELSSIIERLQRQGSDDGLVETKACRKRLSHDVWETVSAFANTSGGTLILGIDEAAGFTPVDEFLPERVINQFVSGIGDGGVEGAQLTNPPAYRIDRVEYGGAQVVVIEIFELDTANKPCFITARGISGGSYKRVDDKDIKLQPAELYELENALIPTQSDRVIVEEAGTEDLDESITNGIIAHELERGARSLRGATDVPTRLARLNLTDNDGKIRLAGLLVAGIYPQQYFPKLVVDVAVHPDVEKSAPGRPRFLDRRVCDGPIGVVIDDAIAAISRNLRTYSIVRGLGRVDELEIPVQVLREALVNALVHREYGQYFLGQSVSVDIYPDRVVITNPGGLWGGKSLETLDDGTSRCRNETLMQLLTSVELPGTADVPAEGNGTGVGMMKREMAARALDEPVFIARMDSFTVVLGRGGSEIPELRAYLQENSTGQLSQSEEAILLLALRRGAVSIPDLHKVLSIDSDELRRMVEGLLMKSPLVEISPGLYGIPDARSPLADTAGKHAAQHAAQDQDADDRASEKRRDVVLKCIAEDSPISTAGIAEATGRSKSSVRYHVRNLIKRGLVSPTAAPTSRNRAYEITDEGIRELEGES
jgi:ATP-dependent DNA helicase RecG